MNVEEIKRRLKETEHLKWFHRFEVIKGSGIYTPGWVDTSPEQFDKMLGKIKMKSKNIKGKRILDIGTSTGALAFYLEDMGADVVAMDVCEPERRGFGVVHEIRGSSVEFRNCPVYDLNPEDFGHFDIVAFFGVHYHLKHPILALERINSVLKDGGILVGGGTLSNRWFHNEDQSCRKGAGFESITSRNIGDKEILNVKNLNELSLCGFSAGHFLRDNSNWFIPNSKCMEAWLETSGFKVETSIVKTFPIKRQWTTKEKEIYGSSINYKAVKVSEPILESVELTGYRLPSSLELKRALMEIEELKKKLGELE